MLIALIGKASSQQAISGCFGGIKVMHRFLTAQGVLVPLSPTLFKSQLHTHTHVPNWILKYQEMSYLTFYCVFLGRENISYQNAN